MAGGGRMLAGGLLNTSASSLPTLPTAAAAAEEEEAAAAQAAAAAAAGPRSAAAAPKSNVRCWRAPGVTAALLLAALAADAPAAAVAGVRCGRWSVAGVAAAAALLLGVLATGVRAGVLLLLLPGAPAGTHTGAEALAVLLLAPTRAAEAGAEGVARLVAVLLPASRFCRLLLAAALLLQPALLLPSKKVGVVLPACCTVDDPPANPVKALAPLGLPESAPAAAAAALWLAVPARAAFEPVARPPAAAAERPGVRAAGLLLLTGVVLAVLPPAAARCRRAEKGMVAGVSISMSHSDPSSQSLPSSPATPVGLAPAPVLSACSTTGTPAGVLGQRRAAAPAGVTCPSSSVTSWMTDVNSSMRTPLLWLGRPLLLLPPAHTRGMPEAVIRGSAVLSVLFSSSCSCCSGSRSSSSKMRPLLPVLPGRL